MTPPSVIQNKTTKTLRTPELRPTSANESKRPRSWIFPITCPLCATKFRWRGTDSTQITCQNCGTRMVLLIERDGSHTVHVDSNESIADMISHWLDSDHRQLGYDDDVNDADEAP